MQVNLQLSTEQAYIWRVAKAIAKDEHITLGELVIRSIGLYLAQKEEPDDEHIQSVST